MTESLYLAIPDIKENNEKDEQAEQDIKSGLDTRCDPKRFTFSSVTWHLRFLHL